MSCFQGNLSYFSHIYRLAGQFKVKINVLGTNNFHQMYNYNIYVPFKGELSFSADECSTV